MSDKSDPEKNATDEQESQEEKKEITEETTDEKSEETEKQDEKVDQIKTEDETEVIDEPEKQDSEEDITEEKKDEQKVDAVKEVDTKQDAGEIEKKDAKKKKDDDFQYIVRIANTDIDGNKKIIHGLTSIKGIGAHMASLLSDTIGIDKNLKMGDLSESQIDKIRKSIEDIEKIAPKWMLNHRNDYESGEDIHLIGPEIDMRLRDEINIMKKIRSYRGIRHERGLPARGQRTRANNRKGLSLGVSKKRP